MIKEQNEHNTRRHLIYSEWWQKVVFWRESHIKEKTFVIILALVVGILGGFAAILLKALIHLISTLITSHLAVTGGNYIFLICPIIGIMISVLYVKYFVKDNISHGVTRVLYA
ncbi:MAG: hypothetical protein K2I94_04815, partial [Muribaculaceae bacterium]|nr:hypothetical protein [Muribaculaceae bacterium]